ncbi:hypothetical protein INR49_007897 [Caranx melampygus]|nr:hypothetical protein INR49_007897 [Caranx melampygus]
MSQSDCQGRVRSDDDHSRQEFDQTEETQSYNVYKLKVKVKLKPVVLRWTDSEWKVKSDRRFDSRLLLLLLKH